MPKYKFSTMEEMREHLMKYKSFRNSTPVSQELKVNRAFKLKRVGEQ